jgi:PAS domain-containing protein
VTFVSTRLAIDPPGAGVGTMSRAAQPRVATEGAGRAYAMAALSVGVALLVGLGMHAQLDTIVFVPFLTAVAVSAALGGTGPALVAMLLSAILCYQIFLIPLLVVDLNRELLRHVIRYRACVFVSASTVIVLASAWRRRGEASLRQTQRQLLRLTTDPTVGMYRVTFDGRVRSADRGAASLTACDSEEPVGRGLAEIIEDRDLAWDLARGLGDARTVDGHVTRFRCSHGSLREVLVYTNRSWVVVDAFEPTRVVFVLPVGPPPETCSPSSVQQTLAQSASRSA